MNINDIASICHEANTALCVVNGDPALPHWENLDPNYQESSRQGVAAALNGAGPRELHESWMKERTAQGWVFGEVLDRTAKVHPCLVDYDLLPPKQRLKDALFGAIVTACVSHGFVLQPAVPA